jgi:hypothetical protein
MFIAESPHGLMRWNWSGAASRMLPGLEFLAYPIRADVIEQEQLHAWVHSLGFRSHTGPRRLSYLICVLLEMTAVLMHRFPTPLHSMGRQSKMRTMSHMMSRCLLRQHLHNGVVRARAARRTGGEQY